MTEEKIEEIIEEAGEPAIFLRKVDVVICNGEDEEPIVIKADSEEPTTVQPDAEEE